MSTGTYSAKPPICLVFVYGTLKRGQCREICWPKKPVAIEPAWAHGLLYDLGPYPALVAADAKASSTKILGTRIQGTRILGEVWRFNAADMPETLRVLDAVEDAAGEGAHFYERRELECHLLSGQVCSAYAYFLVDLRQIAGRQPLPIEADGFCRWPVGIDTVTG